EGTMLTLADLRAHLLRLFISHPERCGIAFGESFGPQQKHVDATVGDGVVTERAGDPAGRMLDTPRLYPGAYALFKLERDLVRDAGINILSGGLVCHFGTS